MGSQAFSQRWAGRDIDLLIYISWSSSLRELESHFHEFIHFRCPTYRKVEEEKLASPRTSVKILVVTIFQAEGLTGFPKASEEGWCSFASLS